MRIMEQLDQDGFICTSKFLGEDEMVVKVESYNFLFWCSCTWGHLHS
jgi:acyl-CoA hydrolase